MKYAQNHTQVTALALSPAATLRLAVLGLGALALVGCSDMNTTQQRTLSGGAIGASAGAVAGALTGGCIGCGAAIGGALGAGGGYVYDQMKK
jgi:osmotically inducible lipoprotein OsmB